jgi:hypothetical protein
MPFARQMIDRGFSSSGPSDFEFVINANTRIQVLTDMTMLARARKHQYAAFIRDEGVLCVWSDNVKSILQEAENLEELLLDYIWSQSNGRGKLGRVISGRARLGGEDSALEPSSGSATGEEAEDPEVLQIKRDRRARPVMMYESILVGCALMIVLALCGLGCSKSGRSSRYVAAASLNFLLFALGTLIKGYLLDGKPIRFVLAVVIPFMITLTLVSSDAREIRQGR